MCGQRRTDHQFRRQAASHDKADGKQGPLRLPMFGFNVSSKFDRVKVSDYGCRGGTTLDRGVEDIQVPSSGSLE
ncbi:unnamed protein product [Linum trigynum]|uniref:Uncharacterized protein n=1 Tax=Linum trigynum TaxID=586398 RepID=A0AAV2E9C4_9ROSI